MPARKKQRLERTASPSGGSAPSITTASSAESSVGSPQVSQQVYLIETDPSDVAVILKTDPDFDPTEYQSVSGTNTQSTGPSSQPLSQLEGDSQLILIESPLNSRQTVPDSQELSISSTSVTDQASVHHRVSPRVIADSQAESQGLTDSHFESPPAQGCDRGWAAPAAGEHTPHIPSGQGPSRDDTSYSCRVAFEESGQSAVRDNTYQSQPPLSPFQNSLTTSSHVIAETPSQSRTVNSDGALSGSLRLNPPAAGGQVVISSQISQAAQITGLGFTGASASDPSQEDNTQPEALQASPAAAASSKIEDRPTSGTAPTKKVLPSPIQLKTTMEGTQPGLPTEPKPSAEDELHAIFDLNAAGSSSEKPSLEEELENIFSLETPTSTSAPAQPIEGPEPLGPLMGANGLSSNQTELTIQSQPRQTQFGTQVAQSLASAPSQMVASQVIEPPEENMSGTLRADMPLDEMPQGTITPSDILRSALTHGCRLS